MLLLLWSLLLLLLLLLLLISPYPPIPLSASSSLAVGAAAVSASFETIGQMIINPPTVGTFLSLPYLLPSLPLSFPPSLLLSLSSLPPLLPSPPPNQTVITHTLTLS